MKFERKNVYIVGESNLYQTNTRMSEDVNLLHSVHSYNFCLNLSWTRGRLFREF